MKRLISLLLLFAMGLSLCACNINIAPVDPVPSTSEETSIDVTTPEESTADITTIQSTPEEESSTPPEQSTTPPEETSTIPVGTTTPPVGTTTPPVGTTTPPIEETTPLPSDEKITIVFYHTMGESLRSVLDKYIVEFNKLYPNITIEHKQVGGYDDVRDQIKTEITVGQQPNIAYCYADHVAEYNVAQAVATLDDFIASMETITRADGTLEQIGLTQAQIDDFIDGFLAEGKVYGDDKMYTMPMSKSTEVLYYNKTFFETHGISVPTTWEEMEQVCEILKALDPDCIPLAYDSEANWFITMCQQYNSPYTSATGNHYLFDNETNRNFVAMFREWYQKGYIITQELYGGYTSNLFTADEGETRCYMCIGSSAGANYHRSYFEVGITTVPQVDPNSPKVISQGPSLCIFKDSNPDEVLASWLFVKFLTTNVDFQAEFSMTSGYLPVLESVADHPVYKANLEYANGYYGLPMLAVQVALAQANAYFTTPAFVGSAMARDQVGVLLQQCLCDSSCATSEGIKKAFENAIKECEYRYPSQNPNPPITPDEPVYDTEAAADYVYNLYADKYVTPADFEVTSKVVIDSIPYTVTWSVDTELITIFQKDANTYIVGVDEESPFELSYILTATVTAVNGSTATRYFSLKVPYYPIWNHEEYMAAKEGEVVVVKGIVVAITSKSMGARCNHLFLADLEGKGGYYCYDLLQDPILDLGIEIGMTVEASGYVAPYSGMQEIKGGTARIVDANKKTVAPVDLTDMFASGESLVNYVGMTVTFKGVQIAGQSLETANAQYLLFTLGNMTSYIRTYMTDFPTTLKADDKATIDAAHAAHYGWKANATGILVMYNNAPYLIPMSVDCFEYIEAVVKTNEEKVADTLAALKMDTTTFSYDTWISLPTSTNYSDVVITWTTDDTTGCVVDWGDGIFSLSIPYGTVTVNFTATATCGYASASKTFAVKLSQELTPISVAIEIGLYMDHNTFSAEKYLVAGIVTEVYNTTYGNMRITDENGNILTIYGSYSADGTIRYDALENKPVAGDYVVLLGSVGHYNGTPQIKNACIISYTNPSKVEDIIALGSAQEHNTYTEEKYLVTGVIVEVYNTQYGNMRITDENGNILTLYGTWDSIGFYRYDSMRVQPVVGDIITVYGLVGQYNGTPQIKNGWIVAHETATPDIPEEPIPEEQTLTIAEAIALGTSQDHNTYTAEKYYVTGVITEVYNTIYGNMYIKDEDGNILTLYGTYDETGANRYDAMDVKPVAGDIITVYGMIGQYNGTPQIKNGWIVAHLIAEAIERTDPCVSDLSA